MSHNPHYRLLQLFDQRVRENPSEHELARLFAVPPKGALSDRFSIYRTGFDVRSEKALESIYPTTKRLLGETAWNELGQAYCRDNPSRSHNLDHLGLRFPEWLVKRAQLSMVGEVARLEREMSLVFHAFDDTQGITREACSRLKPQSILSLRPSVRLFQASCSAVTAWIERNSGSFILDEVPEWAVLYRFDYRVRIYPCDQEEWERLKKLGGGTSLATALDGSTAAPDRVARWLSTWLDAQLLFHSH